MSYNYNCNSLELSKERLVGRICENVTDYLSDVFEQNERDKKQLCENARTIEALMAENALLRDKCEAKDADALRQLKAIPIDFVERFAKECASWPEAKSIYDLLVDYADGDREIKQKAAGIKSHHTRKMNKAMVTNYNYAAGAAHHDSRRLVSIYEEEEHLQDHKLIGNL